MSTPRLFCFGLGYTAHLVARQALALGWRVGGTCRTEEKAAALAREGIEAVVFDGSRASAAVVEALAGVTHVLDSIPPLEEGDPPLLCHGGDLAGATRTLGWAGYLSTTGVYGDCGGEWIDETRVPAPLTAGSLRRLDAEHAWLGFGARTGVAVQVFRLPGIYGPHGRSAIDALREGRARRVVKPGQVFNRIHVEDLVRVLLASMECPDAGRIYNVADEEPAAADEVVAFAAALIGAPLPPAEPIEAAGLGLMAQSFYAECKRVRNDRIKRELGIALAYPTYREGLRAIAAL
jgi:nucleoside-diphosphate-sugar epimerase